MPVDGVTTVGENYADYFVGEKKLSSSTVIQGKDASQLTMDDFFNLLVAQMTNQDMLNPTSDTEFISQMATFATLQGIQTIQEYQLSSYATSYVGKNVVIAYTSDSGSLIQTEGMVDSVSFYDGEPKVIIKNVSYPLYSVMEIKESLSTDTSTDKKDEEEEGDNKGDNNSTEKV